jgi:hypothetical protein
MANLTSSAVQSDIHWIHMPVPKNRVDEEYYALLKGLRLQEETELFLVWRMLEIWRGRRRGLRWPGRWWSALGWRQNVGWEGRRRMSLRV